MSPDIRAVCSFGVVSFFILFLTAAAPHRVHHIAEKLSPPNGSSTSTVNDDDIHGETTSHDKPDGSVIPDCIAASIAQNAHLSFVDAADVAVWVVEFSAQSNPPVVLFVTFNPSPFAERAPPIV